MKVKKTVMRIHLDPQAEYYGRCEKGFSRNYNQSKWLKQFMNGKHYKRLKIEDKHVHPALAFEVIRQFWISFYNLLILGNIISLPFIGQFFIARRWDSETMRHKLSFVWRNKPHEHIKLGISQHFYKEHLR